MKTVIGITNCINDYESVFFSCIKDTTMFRWGDKKKKSNTKK